MAEHVDRKADELATDATALHDLPAELVEEAKQRHRFAPVLHSVAAAIHEERHNAQPMPRRSAG